MAQLLAPGAAGEALVSVVPRDGVPAIPLPAELEAAYARHGLSLTEARPATPAEVAASGSSWAKRLRAGSARPVTLLRWTAAPPAAERSLISEHAAAQPARVAQRVSSN